MALTLTQRLIAAKKPHARLADNEQLLADLKAEQNRLSNARDKAAGESIDFALSEDDRDEAAAKAGRYDRTIKGLKTEIAGLASLIEERRDSDSAKAAEDEKRAAIAERDKLAAEFADFMPGAIDKMVDLFSRIEANEKRMTASGLREPCAEAKARDANRFLNLSSDAPRFLNMKLPAWQGHRRAWPPERNAADWIDMVEQDRKKQIEVREKAELAKREAAAEHARNHARYEIKSKFGGYYIHRLSDDILDVAPMLPATITSWSPWQGELSHELAARLGKAEPNLKITRLDEKRR